MQDTRWNAAEYDESDSPVFSANQFAVTRSRQVPIMILHVF